MKVVILDDYELVSEWAARYVLNQISSFKPSESNYFNLGLPTGSTPIGMYKRLVQYHKDRQLSFKYVRTFNMDEYVGLSSEHPQSYHNFMFEHLFNHVDIQPANVHILNGCSPNLQAECAQFEQKIKQAGGIHLFIGGIGTDGHIAFNEPGSSLVSRTRVVELSDETIRSNARFFEKQPELVPRRALSVGVGTVMDARQVLLLITGHAKARALQQTLEGGINHMCTCSAFQMHSDAIIACDEPSIDELQVKTAKHFKELMRLNQNYI